MFTPINLQSVIEIYITNECNLSCSNCNRFNNYNFSGHYSWEKNQESVRAWSKKITAPLITIIGGEPMLHPDLDKWTELVATSWPDVPVMIQTNGTVKHPAIHRLKAQFENVGDVASLHHLGLEKILIKNKFKKGVDIVDNTEFTDCALIDRVEYFEVHNSNPAAAFDACTMRHSHTLFEGRLYKCPIVAILPEFIKQYQVNLTNQQHTLLESYESLGVDCSLQQLENFVQTRNTHIKQCRLCPEQYNAKKITFNANDKKRSKIIPITVQ
jgi:organic radical activating enzyme